MIQKRKVNTDRLQTKNVSDKLNSAKSKSEHENFIKAWNERIRSIHNLQEVNFMVVQHNLTAINANRYYGINNNKLSKSLEKLSSGYAINRAGDNAAGLAVSEKMRAQISGLTQATKNAQDGISMVQTYEGALTETDSILQRMRSLAVQSANGTYQNDVDREAIQLEFDQLNDELNQIADTDFNGVVVLNGGQMADGLKVNGNGEFDYATSGRVAKQLSSADINKLDSQAMDDAGKANKLWADFGFNRTDADTTNNGPDSVDVTFKYDATKQTWTAISATGGASIDNIKTNTAANNGGFQVGSANTAADPTSNDNLVNVVLDGTTLVNGDTITIRFNNPSVSNTAIENIGVSKVDASGLTEGTETDAPKKTGNLSVKVTNTAIESTNNPTTDPMTADIKKLMDKLDGATVKTTYTAGDANPAFSIQLKGDGAPLTNDQAFTVGTTKFIAKVEDNKVTIGVADAVGTGIGKSLVEFEATKNTTQGGTKDSAGDVVFTLAVDTAKFSAAATPTAEVAKPEGVVSKSNSNNASTATLTYKSDITLQVGARTKDSVNFTFSYESNGLGDLKADLNCSARGLGTDKLSLASQEDANSAIDKIDNAINKVSMVRGTFGAMQNRLEHKIDNLNTTNENLTAAESRIRDTNMAEEMMNFTKNQILSQASQSMLAQANQLPQSVLSLLQ